ncbi:MAG: class I SAM-dependent methyltransferase [candidate division Zixibacteria bacterium]|nr:class I SAM-dependent methyltransferase [candidate division Zixibacteria bacterium]MBU1471274.1 class I SAM-dependent methyltransferase [candidate division Zixibacteria bacterium]MBU2625787.1 class I SAM-dependent methyltransferase [candidate division Zixibacteria bacterium]
MSKEQFDQKYAGKKFYWGTKPSSLVKNFASLANLGQALDLGMGEGRDAIYLAQQDFSVTGVEFSETGIQKCQQRAERLGVNVNTVNKDVRDFRIAKGKYSLILLNNMFQYITKSEAHHVSQGIVSGLKKGGLVIASVFTYDDPRYGEYKKKTTELEPGTFLLMSGEVYSFYDYSELLEFFKPLRLLYYTEYDYYDTHGGKSGHWHGVAELVAMRT